MKTEHEPDQNCPNYSISEKAPEKEEQVTEDTSDTKALVKPVEMEACGIHKKGTLGNHQQFFHSVC
ncbi:hypothetical protein F4X88_00835, partial [Candidatus Poribacteria bacterium]|nr:hypothetical protein [Candidatus Poribacteria bacterium]